MNSRTIIGLGLTLFFAAMSLYEHEQLVRLIRDNLVILVPALVLTSFGITLHSQEIDRFMHPEDYELG